MLIDKIREWYTNPLVCNKTEITEEMAQALIAVDDVLRKMHNNPYASNKENVAALIAIMDIMGCKYAKQ